MARPGGRVFIKRVRAHHDDTWSKRFKTYTGTNRITVTKNGWFSRTYQDHTEL